ncbi:serine hydrolase [uncultured Lactobacillus sp.]|uniref:serine hydrolase n=1 Tax=uncultured Lactobacillus sp. TaxID=153152 RepID=UPI00260D0B92|nr:serine hydrolase [uncultured Lactobacillus sp.]
MIKDELNSLIKNKNIDAGLLITYGDKEIYSYQSDKVFPAAGLVSLGILAYVEKLWQKDSSLLNEELEVTDLSRVRGSGIISRLQQSCWPLRDLVFLVASMSDNAATNLLIERFDIYEIDDWLRDNYPGMRLGRELMRYSPTGQDNEITATSVNKLLQYFLNTNNEFCDIVRNGLSNQTTHYSISTYDNNDFPTYNRMGEIDNYRHEVCSFKTQNGPLTLIALTQYEGQKSEDLLFLQEVGKTIFSKISLPEKKKPSTTPKPKRNER